MTRVKGVCAVDVPEAPTLADLKIDSKSVRQQGHIRLSREQYQLALAAIGG